MNTGDRKELSELGQRIIDLNAPQAYSTLIIDSSGNAQARDLLAEATAQQLLSSRIRSRDDAACVHAALYLWHDCFTDAHTIAQSINTPSGSFCHAILHRRGGDFSNSKYWYARCAGHPALPMIAAQAAPVINPLPADKSILKLTHNGWNPNAFVDLVEQVHGKPDDSRHRLCIDLQRLEWRTLFDHCARAAAGP